MSDSDKVIKVSHVSKVYRRGAGIATLKGLLSGDHRYDREFYALRDVSFEVRRGEVLGIVGANGSGKTTLLSILLGSVFPSAGSVWVGAPVCSMLDLGVGFENGFTGRQNVYQACQLQGMPKGEVDRLFDEIMGFAGVGDIIDTPFKRYSLGERVRLEFAVLTVMDAPIVLVDDILALADVSFREKALSYIWSVARCGRTVVLVSHIPDRMVQLADRVMWLRGGTIERIGDPGAVVRRYLEDRG